MVATYGPKAKMLYPTVVSILPWVSCCQWNQQELQQPAPSNEPYGLWSHQFMHSTYELLKVVQIC